MGHAGAYGGEVRTRVGLECLFLDKLGYIVNTEQSTGLENRGEREMGEVFMR